MTTEIQNMLISLYASHARILEMMGACSTQTLNDVLEIDTVLPDIKELIRREIWRRSKNDDQLATNLVYKWSNEHNAKLTCIIIDELAEKVRAKIKARQIMSDNPRTIG